MNKTGSLAALTSHPIVGVTRPKLHVASIASVNDQNESRNNILAFVSVFAPGVWHNNEMLNYIIVCPLRTLNL